MSTCEQIENMANACLEANELIKRHGTSEIQALMRLLLFQIGQELARRELEIPDMPDRD